MADEGRSFPNPFRSDKSCKEPKKRVGSGGDVLQVHPGAVLIHFFE